MGLSKISPEAGSTAAPPFTVSFIFFDMLSTGGVIKVLFSKNNYYS